MGTSDGSDTAGKIWTYADLPIVREDGRRFEIFDGRLIVSRSPTSEHDDITKRLFLILHRTLELADLAVVYFAPLDVILSPTRVLVPDLVAVRFDRMSIFSDRGLEAAPDLVVEVISPSNAQHDRVRKRRCYAQTKVREYWLVDPANETIEILELIEGGLSYRAHGVFRCGERASSPLFRTDISVNEVFGHRSSTED